MKRNPNCQLCGLHQTAQYVCLLGAGPEPCDIMVIGEAPGEREDNSGKPFVGRAGRLLDDMFETVGLSRSRMYITNAVNCRPPDNRTPKKKEIDACRKWLDYQIRMVKPKFVLTLGNVPLYAMLGITGIKKERGRAVEKDGMIIMPTYHPSYVLRGDSKDRPIVEADLRAFREIIEYGAIPREEGLRSVIVDTWGKVDQLIDALTGIVSIDLETTCLYPWAPEAAVVTCGFGTAVGEFSLFFHHKNSPWSKADVRKIIERITTKLDDCITVFQNGKFDALWMLVHYKVLWHNDFDIMLAHYLVDENSPHDLEFLAQLYFGAPKWDIPLDQKQGNASVDVIADYHAHDLYYTRRLYFKLKKELAKDPQVEKVFRKILMPVANLFVEMEHHGCYIDHDKHVEAEKFLKREIAITTKNLSKWGNINWGSPKQVGELLYGKLKIKCMVRTKKGADSTSESALKQLDHPLVTDLLRFRGAKQQLSFFIDGWKPYIRNDRIHPSFKLHGTVTGRLSSANPNFQQVPRDTLIRSQITAPPGYVLLEADLSQIELRLIAEVSRDPNMMKAFREEIDIHWLTALRELERGAGQAELIVSTAKTLKQSRGPIKYGEAVEILLEAGPDACIEIDKRWKELRKKAKAVNFGYSYGMWWKKFIMYCRDNYDMKISEQEAQASRKAFFDLYQLEEWHNNQRHFARRHGYVRSLFGRKRRLPIAMSYEDTPERGEALRQAINSPIQSCASDLNLITLLQMSSEFPRDVFMPIITVHDAILAEVHQDYVEEVVQRIEEIMRGPGLLKEFEIDFTVPICGDTKIGPWGSGVSFKKWKEQCSKSLKVRSTSRVNV